MKMRMKPRIPGTTATKYAQMGKDCSRPNGLINQPLFSGLVGDSPDGTFSFYEDKESALSLKAPYIYIDGALYMFYIYIYKRSVIKVQFKAAALTVTNHFACFVLHDHKVFVTQLSSFVFFSFHPLYILSFFLFISSFPFFVSLSLSLSLSLCLSLSFSLSCTYFTFLENKKDKILSVVLFLSSPFC